MRLEAESQGERERSANRAAQAGRRQAAEGAQMQIDGGDAAAPAACKTAVTATVPFGIGGP
eukprot:8781782-Lingulodinium_polyedra.AAC.1